MTAKKGGVSHPITASLSGRLRNTQLAKSRALLPLFEAVVNAIQAVDDAPGLDPGSASIEVRISRRSQMAFEFDRAGQPGYAEPIVGFDDRNMESFRTLDSEYKSAKGCRGVGRLLWLKAFQRVEVSSRYLDGDKVLREREFTFTAREGVSQEAAADAREHGTGTEIRLLGFEEVYQKHAPKNVRPIARAVLEHCLWYFVRPTGAPRIIVTDGADTVNLTLLYEEEYILDSSETQQVLVKGRPFFLTHLKLKTGSRPTPELNWCGANRVVFEENLSGKVPGCTGSSGTARASSCTRPSWSRRSWTPRCAQSGPGLRSPISARNTTSTPTSFPWQTSARLRCRRWSGTCTRTWPKC